MITLLLYCLIHFVEAWLEETIIELKNPYLSNYAQLNKREHFRSACLSFCWLIPGWQVCYHLQEWWIIPALPITRRIFFDYGLVLLRNRPRKEYEGNDWWVKQFRKLFGNDGRVKELVVELLIIAGLIVTHLFTAENIW